MKMLKNLQASIEWNFEKLSAPTDYNLLKKAEAKYPHSLSEQMEEYDRLLYAKLHPWRSLFSRMPGG